MILYLEIVAWTLTFKIAILFQIVWKVQYSFQ